MVATTRSKIRGAAPKQFASPDKNPSSELATTTTGPLPVTPSPKKKKRKVKVTKTISSPVATRRKSKSSKLPAPVTPSPTKRRPTQKASSKRRSKSPEAVKSADPEPATRKRKQAARSSGDETDDSGILTSEDLASINPAEAFQDLQVPPNELRPSATLTNGQCFHWIAVHQASTVESADTQERLTKSSAWGSHDATEWVGTIRADSESIVVSIRETPTTTLFRPLTAVPKAVDLRQVLYDYFQLQHSLQRLYDIWSQADTRLAVIARCIPGVRIIDQDPWECLISFICSSNNNIPRITKMLSAIRREYGKPLLTIGRTGQQFYSFPSFNELLERATDADLRGKCGMGYRSKYVMETMKILEGHGGESYLQDLRKINDPSIVQEKLCEFCGVGRKVADCVAIFSLLQDSAIPVDVHVWNIALRDYDTNGDLAKAKSLTPKVYQQVGDAFRSRFPDKAAWASSLLFVAELPSFRPVLPKEVVDEMDQFRNEEQARKQELKASKQKKK